MTHAIAATLTERPGAPVVPGITGPDYKEAVSAGRALVLEIQPKVCVTISFVNEGVAETAVMIHRKDDPTLGTWAVAARKGNGGGRDYSDWIFPATPNGQLFVISGWHKNQGGDPSTQPWYQSAYRLNTAKTLALANAGVQFSAGFEDGGAGNDFNEPVMTITCSY